MILTFNRTEGCSVLEVEHVGGERQSEASTTQLYSLLIVQIRGTLSLVVMLILRVSRMLRAAFLDAFCSGVIRQHRGCGA